MPLRKHQSYGGCDVKQHVIGGNSPTHADMKPRVRAQSMAFVVVAIIAFLLMLVKDEPQWHISIMWGLAAIAASLSRFDLLHPYCWFSCSFALYSSAYAIQYCMRPSGGIGYSRDNLLLPLTAMSVFLLTVGTEPIRIDCNSFLERFSIQRDKRSLKRY